MFHTLSLKFLFVRYHVICALSGKADLEKSYFHIIWKKLRRTFKGASTASMDAFHGTILKRKDIFMIGSFPKRYLEHRETPGNARFRCRGRTPPPHLPFRFSWRCRRRSVGCCHRTPTASWFVGSGTWAADNRASCEVWEWPD